MMRERALARWMAFRYIGLLCNITYRFMAHRPHEHWMLPRHARNDIAKADRWWPRKPYQTFRWRAGVYV